MKKWQLKYMSITLLNPFTFHFIVSKEWAQIDKPGIRKWARKSYHGEATYCDKMHQLKRLQQEKPREMHPPLVCYDNSFVYL